MDFFDTFGASLSNDAANFAAAATRAGSTAITGDITGLNLTPVLQTQAIQQQNNQQLIFLLIIAFVIYKFVIK